MYKYIPVTETVRINKEIPVMKLPFILYRCKPLMPQKIVKQMKVVLTYLALYMKKDYGEQHLPIKGDVALKVGDGHHKVIDLSSNRIYTLFRERDKKLVLDQLGFENHSGMYEEIISINCSAHIIEAIFYNGHHPDLCDHSLKYLKKLNKMFLNLLLESELTSIDEITYVRKLRKQCLELLMRNQNKMTSHQFRMIKEFVDDTYAQFMECAYDATIDLTLSHGDVKQENIIEMKGEYKLIDWEFCKYRNPYFDLLKFITRYPMFSPLMTQIHHEEAHNLNNTLTNRSRYCLLFYLEDIELRLTQSEHRAFAKDISKIIRFIKVMKEDRPFRDF
ncbi:hypothetical protein [Pseudalkalibacillus sp. SCS-8]|uniref:hypothetical protein n=1 Tax=Pseudalkalibacillus nanhaiensis TaxID=3115291 RepID=UPI0032DA2A27